MGVGIASNYLFLVFSEEPGFRSDKRELADRRHYQHTSSYLKNTAFILRAIVLRMKVYNSLTDYFQSCL